MTEAVDRITIHDLMVAAGLKGEPRLVWRKGSDEPPFTSAGIIFAVPGDVFVIEYDDGRQTRRHEVIW